MLNWWFLMKRSMANKINELLTGRAIQFMLYPFSLQEFQAGLNRTEINSRLRQWLVYGLYPGLLNENVEICRCC